MILVVDDDEQELDLVVRLLGRAGLSAVRAADGSAARAVLGDGTPDLVLLDVQLGDISGLDLLDEIRSKPELAAVPVILLTGGSDVVEGLSRGAHDFLTKPFNAAELIARVRAALRAGELIRRLERRSEELDRFAMTAAHDLKSPLAAIRGTASMLGKRWERMSEEQRGELFSVITISADRSTKMIEDLLTLARFDAGEATGSIADAAKIVADVVAAQPVEPGDSVTVAGTWELVAASEPDLRAAVGNLVGNAATYGRSEDGTLCVTITGSVAGNTMVIDIADRGRGIPEGEREKIFEAFYGGPGARQINPASTGIGLAIVRRAAERWRGSVVALDGSPGTVFRLVVPLAPA